MITSIHIPFDKDYINTYSIRLVWLFHVCGILGITMGLGDWFIPKTPVNLFLGFLLMAVNFSFFQFRKALIFLLFFSIGMTVELIGVRNDMLFGNYAYGANLGPKTGGVPLLIGINWALLTFCTGSVVSQLKISRLAQVIIGALLMVILDYLIEASAPIFDFWSFAEGMPPINNYISWFAISLLLHIIYQKSGIKGDSKFSSHLYTVQLVFFTWFYVFNSL